MSATSGAAEATPIRPAGGPLLRGLRAAGRGLLRLPRPARVGLAIGWAGLIWWLSSDDSPPTLRVPLGRLVGNLAHAPLFGLLALWVVAAALPRAAAGGDLPRLERTRALVVFALVLAYAIVDEVHQASTQGRHATPRDVVTDLVGALCVLDVVRHVARADAGEAGLRWRLARGVGLCVLAAALATWP